MKFALAICVFYVLFVALQAMSIKEHGVVKNQQFIDRESTYAAADPNGYAQKAFTFPPVCFLFWNIWTFNTFFSTNCEMIFRRKDHRTRATK